MFGFLFVMSANNGLLAQESTRSVKDQTELSETVNKVFSKKVWTQISNNSSDAGVSTVPNSVEMTALAIRELPAVGEQLATPLPKSKTFVLASPSQIYDSHKMTADGIVYTLGVSREGVLRYLETQDESFATPDGVSIGMRLEDLERSFGSPILNEPGFAYFVRLPSGWNAAFYDLHGNMPPNATVSLLFQR